MTPPRRRNTRKVSQFSRIKRKMLRRLNNDGSLCVDDKATRVHVQAAISAAKQFERSIYADSKRTGASPHAIVNFVYTTARGAKVAAYGIGLMIKERLFSAHLGVCSKTGANFPEFEKFMELKRSYDKERTRDALQIRAMTGVLENLQIGEGLECPIRPQLFEATKNFENLQIGGEEEACN